jgi:hypothetical protein
MSTCNAAVYGELGRFPMWLKLHERIIKYWFKLLATENCILKSIYENIVRCNENKYWGNKIKELLCKYGFQEVWLYLHSVDVNIFAYF